tara:strand:- start:569 stop:751 length:183 start_codon:yes stop_codon:yes gene_type:complete
MKDGGERVASAAFVIGFEKRSEWLRPHTGCFGTQLVAETRKPMPLKRLNDGVEGSYSFKT